MSVPTRLPAVSRSSAEHDAISQLCPSGAYNHATLFRLEELSFRILGRTLLEPLSLNLPAGRIVGLIGHNGSGKSTLLKILARQQSPTSGAAYFEDKPLEKWGHRELARRLAYLPQHVPPASGMLVRELVALGRYPWHGALRRFGKVDREKVAEAIELTGIAPFAERLVDTLSGGERQRVWLAMLVAQDTECLLLDEPTSALDISHQIEVLSLIGKLSRERGLGIVLVLHDVNMAAHYCDEIIALHTGRMIARSSPDAIMTTPTLRRIYDIDMQIVVHPIRGTPIALP